MQFKIFSSERLEKYKIKRALIAGTLTVALSLSALTGCAPKKTHSNITKPVEETTTKSIALTDPYISYVEDDYIETDTIETEVDVDTESLEEFISYLDSIETTYPHSELFEIESVTANEKTFHESSIHIHDIRDSNGNLTVDALVESVLKNNQIYYENLGSMRSFYQEMPTEEIRAICQILIDNINKVAETNHIDMDMLSCKLGNLKMFYKTNIMNASVSTDDVLSIDPNVIKVAQVIAGEQDAKTNTIIHECMHLIQDACSDYETEYRIATSYRNADLSINPLYWSWYIEAAAEKLRIDLTGDPAIVYEYQIGYMESIALAITLNPNYEVYDLEEYSITKDREKFFSMFDLSYEEIVKMMYSIEIIQAEPDEFKEVYEAKYGEGSLSAEKLLEIKRQVKSSICETLSKIFYKNLALNIANNDTTLEDCFYLIKVFESDLFSHLRYDNEIKREFAIPFMQKYSEIQTNFFKMLTVENIKADDIKNYFDNYSMRVIYNGEKIDANCSFKWLEDSKKVYVFERKDAVYSKVIEPIVKNLQNREEKALN